MNQDDYGLLQYTFYRGRVALYAILRALGIGKGDEVAIQAFTCLAVPEGIMATGARPLYIDIREGSVNMDHRELQKRLTNKTRAIVVQHTFGIPADMSPIMEMARLKGLPVIEDCCHTICSKYEGKRLGTFGAAAFYSYEWGKPLVAGIGGSAVVHDSSLSDALSRVYETFSIPDARSSFKLDLQYFAFALLYRPSLYWPVKDLFHRLSASGIAEGNYNPIRKDGTPADDFCLRMLEPVKRRLTTAIGSIGIVAEHSRQVTGRYLSEITAANVSAVDVPTQSEVVYARYPLFVTHKEQALAKALRRNVELSEWYSTPVHPFTSEQLPLVYYTPGSCPNAEIAAEKIVSLPTHRRTSQKDVNKIVGFFAKTEAS